MTTTDSHTPSLIPLSFETDEGFGARGRIGLVVLESDQTIEAEARLLELPGVDWYHARIPMESEVTPTTLTDMEARLPEAAGLLPTEFEFDAVGYGCTSAATLIGEDGVAAALGLAHPGTPTSNPITAAVAAFRSLGSRRVAVVTPYTADVTGPVVELFERQGLEVTAFGSFLEASDLVVARISEESIAEGVRHIVGQAACDAVFISCTSLRAFGIAENLEAELGVPVVSSNLALFWHLLRLAGINDNLDGLGRLYRTPLTGV